MSTFIVVRKRSDQSEVHAIDVTDKTERQIERIEMGMAINFDFEQYTYGAEER